MLYFQILIFSLFSFSKTIVIDPGHGGDEVGAVSYFETDQGKIKILEKDLTLQFALKLKQYIGKNHNVILTRRNDEFIPLEKRAQIAAQNKAHAFISIHFNSSPHKLARGVETYYLNEHNDQAIYKLEKLENRVGKSEDKIIDKILIDLAIQFTSKASHRLGNHVHSQLKNNFIRKFKLKDRGLKPSLFHVLALSQVPSILLEAGFMSNQNEISKILSQSYQDQYAKSVAKGLMAFLKD